jgi:arylsulfatase A-like enzyme
MCIIAVIGGHNAVAPADDEPLNVLLLYADDWRHDTLGCAGHPVVKTPRLDALAQGGVRFTRACVTTSICGVSRASLLTGQWMSRHGNRAFGPFQTPWSETYPGRLRDRDYWVGHVGKWHNGPFPTENYDFSRILPMRHHVTGADGQTRHVTQQNELDALEFLRTRPNDQPFCLTVSFFAPHAEDGDPKQYLCQPESAALYRDVEIPIPFSAGEEHVRKLPPFISAEKNEGRRRWHWRFDTPAKYQEYMKAYYRLVSEVDVACGRIIDELREQNLLDRTFVIFTTDNGYFHGEHGLADKWYPYEESIRVPLIIRDPRLPAERRGETCDEFALNVDLAPTILAAAESEIPAGMQGRDLSPLLRGETPADWRQEFFYEHGVIKAKDVIPASEAVVTKHAKYIFWPDFEYEELFDLRVDPQELHNIAPDQNRTEQLQRMRETLSELKAAAR